MLTEKQSRELLSVTKKVIHRLYRRYNNKMLKDDLVGEVMLLLLTTDDIVKRIYNKNGTINIGVLKKIIRNTFWKMLHQKIASRDRERYYDDSNFVDLKDYYGVVDYEE